jgi:hypothetical protein
LNGAARIEFSIPVSLSTRNRRPFRIEPLGKCTGLQANMFDLAAPMANETSNRLWLALTLALLDDDAALVDNADARSIEGNIDTDKELHELALLADFG